MISGSPELDLVVREPPLALRGLIDGYLGYRMSGFAPALHRGLPSSHMTFIVSIGSPIVVVEQTSPAQRPDRYRCVLSGLQASSAVISHDGCQEGVAIELTPLGCRALFGMPARELWDLSFEFGDVVGRRGEELWDRLQYASTWSDRFHVCDDVLTRMMTARQVAPELASCWRGIIGSAGQVPVAALADHAGYSRQHLARLFRAEFGLGPKLASRVVRFDAAQRELRSQPGTPLADIAQHAGFADQAHFTRECLELAGCTPRELRAESVPKVQESVTANE
ncbi:helix-turn-helix transcriptional regulator [Hoyosella altamirensis]|uniref:AraC-like DNA-binding protein n=1 Tax=Hoyosella altamirensis TaxID=616997 RepID=A0A839RKA8_9ACTN|nr:helix-turn-helix transcriptional regulator [Hoyosella altamirensis]MBB3036513.1 AraC-like DNA-binding protein [Hoyosella altamirensis]